MKLVIDGWEQLGLAPEDMAGAILTLDTEGFDNANELETPLDGNDRLVVEVRITKGSLILVNGSLVHVQIEEG